MIKKIPLNPLVPVLAMTCFGLCSIPGIFTTDMYLPKLASVILKFGGGWSIIQWYSDLWEWLSQLHVKYMYTVCSLLNTFQKTVLSLLNHNDIVAIIVLIGNSSGTIPVMLMMLSLEFLNWKQAQ